MEISVPAELDAELSVERQANGARLRVTHWMMRSAPEARQAPASFAGVARSWPDRFTSQDEDAGLI